MFKKSLHKEHQLDSQHNCISWVIAIPQYHMACTCMTVYDTFW